MHFSKYIQAYVKEKDIIILSLLTITFFKFSKDAFSLHLHLQFTLET